MAGMERIEIRTDRRDQLVDVTDRVAEVVGRFDPAPAAVLLHVPHTTAGVTINEGYDPAVADDVLGVLARLVPHEGGYRHMEGNSDSHVKAIATGSSQLVPVEGGAPALGRWQRIFFCEFDGPRTRQLWISPIG
jgi:secondary thiamine-phosphate synthase enzyme